MHQKNKLFGNLKSKQNNVLYISKILRQFAKVLGHV